jgi:hypothetical protein
MTSAAMITPPMKANLLLAGAAACSLTADF